MAAPLASLLALSGDLVAVAAGSEVRVLNLREQRVRTVSPPPPPAADGAAGECISVPPIRALVFSEDGRFLAAGGDDKEHGVRIWDADSLQCILSLTTPKKVGSLAFSPGGGWLLAGDKTGDVLGTQLPQGEGSGASLEVLLGHYNSTLTSLAVSASGRTLATADRDGRVRITRLPQAITQGLHEIQAICLGHTEFVTSCAFVRGGSTGAELLATGGGDGTLRLWQPSTGALLQTVQLSEGETQAEKTGGEDAKDGSAGAAAAVLGVAASSSGRYVAAVMDGRDEVFVARVDQGQEEPAIKAGAWSQLPGLHIPSQICFDSQDRLWAVGGPPSDVSTSIFLACGSLTPDGQLEDALAGLVPADVRAAMEARGEEEAAAQEGQQPKRLLAAHLVRHTYPTEEMEHRKRNRRDKRQKQVALSL